MEEIEVWKDIPGYESKYQVSNLGNVKSLSRIKENGRFTCVTDDKVLKANINGKGRRLCTLTKDGKRKTFPVHQLVVMAFFNHVPCGMNLIVDHIDNNPLNNNLINLQLISNRENASKDKKGYFSKYVGVSFFKPFNKYRARITIAGKEKALGYFVNEIDAHNAYQNALKEL